jgi:hypothetical protein
VLLPVAFIVAKTTAKVVAAHVARAAVTRVAGAAASKVVKSAVVEGAVSGGVSAAATAYSETVLKGSTAQTVGNETLKSFGSGFAGGAAAAPISPKSIGAKLAVNMAGTVVAGATLDRTSTTQTMVSTGLATGMDAAIMLDQVEFGRLPGQAQVLIETAAEIAANGTTGILTGDADNE